jgi:hypothetical protein
MEGAERETGRVMDRQDRGQAVWKRERTGDTESGRQEGLETGSLGYKQDRRQAVWKTSRTGDRRSGRQEG